MTWVVWRQHRLQAAVAGALLAALAVLLAVTGLRLASQYRTALAGCTASGDCSNLPQTLDLGVYGAGTIVTMSIGVPLLLGLFWGAPLLARELETGTSQFAWTQGVTRHRWLAFKAGWLLLAAAACAGAVSALVTWWSGPKNSLFLDIFSAGFDYQGVVPVAYAVFAVALGIAAGAALRRTLPTLAVTLAGYVGVRSLIAEYAREHYMTPVTRHFDLLSNFEPSGPYWLFDRGIITPHGVLSQTFYGATVNGVPIAALPARCREMIDVSGSISKATLHAAGACVRGAGYRGFVTYQPAGRFWIFQGIEAGIFVALAGALIAVAFWIIRRRDA
ncbi:MAG: hypothetical protein LBV34_25950 [Nocardiopsaceae bacterium]|nr:hypothetical protein [Nocardiopsaceae bacterium]